MAIIAKAGGDCGGTTPAPEGAHQAVCVDVIDKGMVESNFDGKPKMQHKVSVAWQIDATRDDGKRFVIYKRYTLSLNEKATLRKDLESWRGRAFTREEEMGFDVESVIGANCLINVQHAKKGDKTYANVVSVMPLFKGLQKMVPVGYVRDEPQSHGNDEPEPPPPTDDDEPPF
jgi:hypothetical protein